MSYRGEIRGGVVVLEKGVALPEGTFVTVEPLRDVAPSTAADGEEDALARMGEFAVETGIKDLASNADHYLYGHPKVEDVK